MTVLSSLIKILQIAPLLKTILNNLVPFVLNKLLNLPKAAEKYEEVKKLINEQVKQVRHARESVMNAANKIKSLRKSRTVDDSEYYEPEETIKNSETVTSAVKHIVSSGASSILPGREKKNNQMMRSDKTSSMTVLPQSEHEDSE